MWFWVLGFGFWVSCFVFGVSGFGFLTLMRRRARGAHASRPRTAECPSGGAPLYAARDISKRGHICNSMGPCLLVRGRCLSAHGPRGLSVPPEALCGGISKVNFQETLSSFGDKCPQNGSKNGLRAPRTGMACPHIGPSVGRTA